MIWHLNARSAARTALCIAALALASPAAQALAQNSAQNDVDAPLAAPDTDLQLVPLPDLVPLSPDFPGFEEEPDTVEPDLPPDLRDPRLWSRVCTRAGCTIAARLVSVQEGRLLASVAMTHDLRGEVPVLAVFTPLGMATRPGVRLLVNEQLPVPVEVDVCLPDGCRATLELDRETFETILEARSFAVQYFAFGRPAPLSFPLSMSGYDAATDHLPEFWRLAAEIDATAAPAAP